MLQNHERDHSSSLLELLLFEFPATRWRHAEVRLLFLSDY